MGPSIASFRIGPVCARYAADLRVWIVTRESWLRCAVTREEAERFARQMATDFGAPIDMSIPLAVG